MRKKIEAEFKGIKIKGELIKETRLFYFIKTKLNDELKFRKNFIKVLKMEAK